MGRREFYREWSIAALIGYAQVYKESGIPTIWGKLKMSKEYAKNCQELMVGVTYWAKINCIEIDTAVLFVKLAIEETVTTKSNPGVPVAMYDSAEIRISPLMVIPRTTQDIDKDIRQEEADDESKDTRTKFESFV